MFSASFSELTIIFFFFPSLLTCSIPSPSVCRDALCPAVPRRSNESCLLRLTIRDDADKVVALRKEWKDLVQDRINDLLRLDQESELRFLFVSDQNDCALIATLWERAIHEFLRVLRDGTLAEDIQEVLSPRDCNVELCDVHLVYGSSGWPFPAPFQATGMLCVVSS